jgi:hypothetical protein
VLALALAAAAIAPAPPMAVVPNAAGHDYVAQIDPLTLRPVGTRIRFPGNVWGSAWSPDGRRLAFATLSGRTARIQIVDVARKRTTARILVSRRDWFPWLAWAAPDRLLAVGGDRRGDHTLLAIDPLAGRVVRRSRLGGRIVFDGLRAGGGGAVALLAPRSGAGPTTLAVVSPAAAVRRIALPRIRARLQGHQRFPGLAADATRAFVASATSAGVTAVDLATGAATEHAIAPRPARGAFVAAPRARAAKDDVGQYRQAALLGGGLLALAGYDALGDRERRANGLRLIDIATWTTRLSDPRVSYFRPAPEGILVGEGARGARTGVAAYGPDGTRRFDVLNGLDVGLGAVGGYVYAHTYRPRHRTYVLDARTGRTLRTLKTAIAPRFL